MGRGSPGGVETARVASGVRGFDEITGGGLPRGRVTVVLGGAGCGKTIFALQTLATGATSGEPGLFVSFEETPEHVLQDASKFDFKLATLAHSKIGFVDAQLSQTVLVGGDFDLLGLLAIVGAKATALGARRIVFDGLDVLLGHLESPALIRREAFRLRDWLYSSELTGIITAKADLREGLPNTDYDFLQFIADCVVSLQHRVTAGSAIRVLRVAKYRGQAHSSNEFPFTITSAGLDVAAGTSSLLHHAVSAERVTSGVEQLDAMLGGGYYRGSSVLISGAPGTSKTSLAAAFAEAACKRKEPTLFVSFDEAPEQIIRNVASIGIDLRTPLKAGTLRMCSLRARSDNPESHVARIRTLIEEHGARNLVVDPISALGHTSDHAIADRAAVQTLDIAKALGVTSVSTSLLANAAPMTEETPIGISTISDTWMHVSYISKSGERNRALTIVKSRGMNHSNQVRELMLSDAGIHLAAPYMSNGEVLMGTLRWERESADRRAHEIALVEADLRQKQAELALAETRVRIEAARTEQAMREGDLQRIMLARRTDLEADRVELIERTQRRGGEPPPKSRGRAPR